MDTAEQEHMSADETSAPMSADEYAELRKAVAEVGVQDHKLGQVLSLVVLHLGHMAGFDPVAEDARLAEERAAAAEIEQQQATAAATPSPEPAPASAAPKPEPAPEPASAAPASEPTPVQEA